MKCLTFILSLVTSGQYFLISGGSKIPNPLVKTESGWIEGQYGQSFAQNRTYMQFLGIPYAKAPVGLLRLEPPQPMSPWKAVFRAHKSTICMQVTHDPDPPGGNFKGVEDCLHLNIYISRNSTQNLESLNLDVIVYIHGGAFSFGSGALFRPDYLMDQEIVFVSINYRLGILGFFSTESSRFPGNMALKDQVLALKWIRSNIRQFGGNPNSITIAGLSSGAGSVSYHTLSPQSRGLFQKAISMSGSALRPLQGRPFENAKKLGSILGCNQKNKISLGLCIKSTPAQQIAEAIRQFRPWLFNPFAPFSAVVDGKWSTSPFLPEHPLQLLRKKQIVNDVPWLVSFTTDEGLYPAAEFLYNPTSLPTLDKNWNVLAPYILHLHNIVPDEDMLNVTSLIRSKYLGNSTIDTNSFQKVVDIISDRLFKVDLELTARYYAAISKSPVYVYHYDYVAESVQSYAMHLSGKSENLGAGHGDDTLMILPATNLVQTSNDKAISDYLINVWMTFAKNGKLDDWIPVGRNFSDPLNYKLVGSRNCGENRSAPEIGNRDWWESLKIRQTN